MAAFLNRLRAWWNKDALAKAEEETHMSPLERDVAEEDYEARKEDQSISRGRLAGGTTDYERDSEPPRDPAP
jgi:hypothetical protein